MNNSVCPITNFTIRMRNVDVSFSVLLHSIVTIVFVSFFLLLIPALKQIPDVTPMGNKVICSELTLKPEQAVVRLCNLGSCGKTMVNLTALQTLDVVRKSLTE